MNVLDIFGGGVDKVVTSVGNAIDQLVTSDEERLVLQNELTKIKAQVALEQENQYLQHEKEITTRWTSDNEHVITRLVRPVSYAGVLILFGAVVLSDGNIGNFKINPQYIGVLETLLTTMTIALFGSRGYEKVMRHKHGKVNADGNKG